MVKTMLIDATHEEETRVAVVDGHRLVEFDYESKVRKQLKGGIFLAKITRVEPSLQAAFVNFGGNRHGFLPFSEIHPDYFRIPIADREALLAAQMAELEEHDEEDHDEDQEPHAHDHEHSDEDEDDEEEDIVEEVGGEDKPGVDIDEEESLELNADDSHDDEDHDDDEDDEEDHDHEEHDSFDQDEDDEEDDAEEGALGNQLSDEEGDDVDGNREPGEAAVEGEGQPRRSNRGGRGRGRGRGRDGGGGGREGGRGGRRSEARSKSVEMIGGDGTESDRPFRYNLRRQYKIQEVIKRGQIMLIQVSKEERGNKGAAVHRICRYRAVTVF
jgi:ribonuclease E